MRAVRLARVGNEMYCVNGHAVTLVRSLVCLGVVGKDAPDANIIPTSSEGCLSIRVFGSIYLILLLSPWISHHCLAPEFHDTEPDDPRPLNGFSRKLWSWRGRCYRWAAVCFNRSSRPRHLTTNPKQYSPRPILKAAALAAGLAAGLLTYFGLIWSNF